MAHPELTGVLLVNLGSPEAPTAPAVRRYLAEFLSDPRVVDLPRALWWPILHGIVLPLRSPRSAALYRRVWTSEGSPLIRITERQAEALRRRLGAGWIVRAAMRYGRPSLGEALDGLRQAGAARIVAVPLFPQFAGATVGSVVARIGQWRALSSRDEPAVRILPPYHGDDGFLAAQADVIRRAGAAAGGIGHHVFSFHGLPMSQVRRGDPYPQQCAETARALAARLDLEDADWTLVYQSRFGPQAWLQPYASEAVPALAPHHRRVLVACPGFAADCLETLDEIGEVLAADFRAAGGERLVLAPCVNDDPAWIDALERLVRSTAGQPGAPGSSR